MHYLYFVKIKEAKNSEDAKNKAIQVLEQNNFASENNGYFSCSKADWYVIGGRWSGILQEIKLGINFVKEAYKIVKPKDNFCYTNREIKENKEKFDTLWKKFGGVGLSIFDREGEYNGFEDDAMILTDEMLKNIKNRFVDSDVEVFDYDNFTELTIKELGKDDVGSWFITIDYHN